MIKDRLLDINYYHNKLPLYMRNMTNLKEHFNLWYDLLIALNKASDDIFKYLNIFDDNYFKLVKVSPQATTFDFLDKLGSLWGVNRSFTCVYDLEGKKTQVLVNLNNEEFLKLIKARLLRNNFQGTYEELNVLNRNILQLNILYVTGDTPGVCEVYADESSFYNNDIRKHLFYSGLYNCDSLGIVYKYHIVNLYSLGLWDSTSTTRKWDNARWG